jgi:probable rRNA maturation factor
MLTETLIEDDRWSQIDLCALAEKAAQSTLKHLKFRNKPTPTNVLSWPSDERASETDGGQPDKPALPMDAELGDIAISYDTCEREAATAGKPMDDHVTHLIIHGVLHLLGYDHIRDLDATLMEETEVQILGTLGIETPY